MPSVFFIGWDVGGWNCEKNKQSRDAIVILDRQRRITGKSWRGNLRESINTAKTTKDWIANLFNLCQAKIPEGALRVTMAIDTPLGFPIEFMKLASNLQWEATIGKHRDNPYLFRQTDRRLYDMGFHPLSPIKDMIGSQATKGLHVLARFTPDCERCGVWSDGGTLQAIEAYPSISYSSPSIQRLRKRYTPLEDPDQEDALTCALVAYLFSERRESLAGPDPSIPPSEGWIWAPRDLMKEQSP